MSKSLKNFSTIKEMLTMYSSKQVRFMFLLHSWSVTMNYSADNSFPEAIAKEKQFNEFFKNVKATLRQCDIKGTDQSWTPKDKELEKIFFDKQSSVRAALCDSFDTPKAIAELSDLIKAINLYLELPSTQIKIPLVRQVSKFIFHIMKCFGVYEDGDFPSIGGQGEESFEDTITPLMNVLLKFRDTIKTNADKGPKELFQLCDELRDDILPYLGL
jgi:cysteinyl-tRNA synthetase